MNFDSVQRELLNYCKGNGIWKLFLPIAELLIIVTHLCMVVSNFVSLGIFSTIVAILASISIVMVLAKGNYKVMTIGLLLRVADYAIGFIKPIISTHPRFNIGTLIYGLIWFAFLLLAFKKSGMTVNEIKSTVTSVDGMKKTMNLDEAKQFNMNDVKNSMKEATNSAKNVMNQVKDEMKQNNNPMTNNAQ